MTTRAPLLAIATLSLLLVGCVPTTPQPTGTPSADAPSATPSPTPTPATVALVTVLAESVTVTDSAGEEISTLDYFAPIDEVRAELTEAFGFEPAVAVVERTPSDRFAGTIYDWQGFSVSWFYGFDGEPGSGVAVPPFEPTIYITATTASVGEVAIETADGLRVGDDGTGLGQAYPEAAFPYTDANGQDMLAVHIGTVPLPVEGENAEGTYTFSVSVSATVPGSVVSIYAPAKNYGI
jgi:hypothetical protein